MTFIRKSLTLAALAAFALSLTLVTPTPAAAQLNTEQVIKNLMSLGVAAPVSGELLAGSIIDPTSVTGASLQSTDNLLNTVSLDAALLATRGRGMLIVAWGTTAANANAKDIKLKIGGTAIVTISGSTASAKDFLIVALVVRDGVNTERGTGFVLIDGALVAASSINFTASVSQAATMAIITTGNNTAAAASAATGKGLTVIPIG